MMSAKKAGGFRISVLGSVLKCFLRPISTKATSKMAKRMAVEFVSGQMADNMKDSGLIANSRALVPISGPMDKYSLVIG